MRSFDECVTTSIAALTVLRRSLRFGAAPSRGPCSIHAKPMCIFVPAKSQRPESAPGDTPDMALFASHKDRLGRLFP
jgi:hypothetical protein